MMRRFKLRISKPVRFALFLGLIVAFGAGFGFYTRNRQQKAPEQSLSALQSRLNEVVLIVGSINSVDGRMDTSPYSIFYLIDSLKKSLETTDKLTDKHADYLKEDFGTLKEAFKTQNRLFEEFQASYKVLGRAIFYNPSLDVGDLDTSTRRQDINQRSQAAYDNLNKLANSYQNSFTEEAYGNLVNSINCFGELADLSKTDKIHEITSVRQRCINIYPATREQLIKALQKTYASDKSYQSLEVIKKAVSSISS